MSFMKGQLRLLPLLSCLLFCALLALAGCAGDADSGAAATAHQPSPTVSTGLPNDIPIYPGAQLVGTPAPGQASFEMPGSPHAISNFYQSQMPQHGWKTIQVQDNGADGIVM